MVLTDIWILKKFSLKYDVWNVGCPSHLSAFSSLTRLCSCTCSDTVYITCIQRPLKGSYESGLLQQVVSKCRFY